MATYDFTRATLPFFADRLGRMQSDTRGRWGSLDAPGAVRHLIFTFECSLGERNIEDRTIPVVRDLIYLVFFRWFTTWPQGKIKGPDYLCPKPQGEFAEEQATLLHAMERFVDLLEREPTRRTVNPGIGSISLARWSRVHGVHCDHHLRQFGV